MRWVLQNASHLEQKTTQPNRPKQTKISPGKRACVHEMNGSRFVGRSEVNRRQNKNGSPVTSCRSSDEGAPSERLGESHLLHVHVFRQAIEPAFRVPRLDHQNVSAFGSGDRLVKGWAG
jgi:hypothetical protein